MLMQMKCIILSWLLIANAAFACSEFHWDWDAEKWAKESTAIYYGMVASISLDNDSIYDGETDPLINVISLRGEQHIKFKVFETLKGETKAVVETVLPECVGGVAEFGDTALLFKVGEIWHIKPLKGDYADETASDVLLRLSKVKRESGLKP